MMEKTEKKAFKLTGLMGLCLISAVLMVAMIALQFTPFWSLGEEGAEIVSSIGQYIWRPSDCKPLEKALKAVESVGSDFKVGHMVLWPVVLLVASAAGAVLCVIKPKFYLTSAATIVAGLAGMIGYLTVPALKLGTNWALHMGLSAVILAAGVLMLYMQLKKTQK